MCIIHYIYIYTHIYTYIYYLELTEPDLTNHCSVSQQQQNSMYVKIYWYLIKLQYGIRDNAYNRIKKILWSHLHNNGVYSSHPRIRKSNHPIRRLDPLLAVCAVEMVYYLSHYFMSLRLSGTIWRQPFWSTLVQISVVTYSVPSHYLL